MTSLLLDNPFSDTSKTHDTNLLYFNSIRAFYKLLNPDPRAPIEISVYKANNITSRDQLRNHVSSHIFGGLIRSMEAQSYLRFIYRNIFSKINLIQLIAFINEKEA